MVTQNETDSNLPCIAYFIDGLSVRSGALIAITEPPEGQGGGLLYEFGHGFATPIIFDTEQDAINSLKGNTNNE
jgi:hypothetical protein